MIGPENPFSQELHAAKYRDVGETFDDYCVRYARTTASDEQHFRLLLDALRNQRLLPAGRQQLAVGRPYQTTALNCFVGGAIGDSMAGIMAECTDSAMTLRTGGGCGWDFSTIRPHGDRVSGLGFKAYATGPVSFMSIWNAMCSTVMSAGHRRGAMMGVLRVDHPDIMRFVNAKQDQLSLANFNISVGITDAFMEAVEADASYDLRFDGRVYGQVRALNVWARIMERNWDWAEPGVLFLDTINRNNPLWYCETIAATNPCGEQPLPANGACLLGSLNIVKYVVPTMQPVNGANVLKRRYVLDLERLADDVAIAVGAFDAVIDRSHYPLERQRAEHQTTRRMGIGPTGMANAIEICGHAYGSDEYIAMQDRVLATIRDSAYRASIALARDRGAFPKFDAGKYLAGPFAARLPEDIRDDIARHGIRNGVLLSIAPTGTISMCADNVSSGIEPPYQLKARRLVNMPEGPREVAVDDFASAKYGVAGRTAAETSAADHVRVLCAAQAFVNSAVSKTCNVAGQTGGSGPGVTFAEFKQLYRMAWEGGAKGCTTFNINGERRGIFTEAAAAPSAACTIDPETGIRSCEA